MLTRLSIRNIVLIEALDLDFARGLGVLTGETGTGKSIRARCAGAGWLGSTGRNPVCVRGGEDKSQRSNRQFRIRRASRQASFPPRSSL